MSSSEDDDPEATTSRQIVDKSALCVIPPENLWQQIQDIRKDNDKAFGKLMPHINLLYPFYHESNFEDIAKEMEPALSAVPAFSVTLKEFDYFRHKSASALFLKPEVSTANRDGWNVLFAKVAALYPDCVSAKDRDEFTPHMIVGQWSTANVTAAQQQHQARWQPLTFTVGEVCLISRRGESYEVRKRIPLKR